ncbi:MAG: DNA-deoxyinosine glycosylase, partial [Clostridia bacterium]|nr:DNA-deoxyinosine glycosylase [Clostridia bacterium]
YNENSLILILGSFPSVKSREVSFYYGNKQNRFWKMLSDFFGMPIDTIDEKKKLLSVNKIALWDIVTKCEITGSLDSAIKNYSVADVSSLLTTAPNIKKILINGQTANKIFTKHFHELSGLAVCLPSTSPANTRFDKSAWLDELEILSK